MHKIAKSILFLMILLIGFPVNAEEFEVEQLTWLEKADPTEDLNKAIRIKDYRFIGLFGFSTNVPSVGDKCLIKSAGIKYIEGTSDALVNYEHAKLNAIASVYARYYNVGMYRHLKSNNIFKCDL
jgi:hypothetical protein